MRLTRLIQGLLFVCLLGIHPAVQAQLRLPVELLTTRSVPITRDDGSVYDQILYAAITVRGRLYEVVLEPSETVTAAAVVMFEGEPVDRVAPMHYQGQILGVSGSWVRLSWVNGLPEGMIRIGHQLLLIDYDPMLGELLATELLDEHAELDQRPPDSPVSSAALSENLKVLPLSIVLDTLYNEAHDGLGLERALTIVNAVDGLYQEQLGLRLELRTVRLLIDPGADPMRRLSGDIDELLNVFRRFRLGDVTIARGQGAVHLFSGAKLADKRVGLAYIDTICRSDGYDVGVSRVVDRDVFTFAHELAHNLGAEHDLDTQCGDDGRMMNATLRSDMQYAFSACSVKSIRRGMQRTCVLDQPALQFAAAGLDEAESVVD